MSDFAPATATVAHVCVGRARPVAIAGRRVATAIAQSATQVQDQSVSAVPRLVACAIALLALASWMVSKLVSFAQTMFAGVP